MSSKRAISVLALALLLAAPIEAQTKAKTSSHRKSSSKGPDLTLCPGPFALCAASTCKFTGKRYPNTKFREVVCTCPILQGPALAALHGGNMQGSCKPPIDPQTGKDGIWSLYSLATCFPQQVNGVWQKDIPASNILCPAASGDPPKRNYYGQCFSYSCRNVHEENGIPVADCYCPALLVLDPERGFNTEAGQCQTSVCTQIPVGGPFNIAYDFCANPPNCTSGGSQQK